MFRPLLALLLLTTSASAADFRAFLDTHCLECHDSDAKKGDLDLSRFTNEDAVMKDRAIWRSVYEKIESHQMPPPKQKSQPTEAQRQKLMAWIMDIAARPDAAPGVRDPGKPDAAGTRSVLDAVMGSGISDGDQHNYADLEVLIAGGHWKRGHFHYEGKRPLADLWLTLAQRAGVKRDRFADSTELLKGVA